MDNFTKALEQARAEQQRAAAANAAQSSDGAQPGTAADTPDPLHDPDHGGGRSKWADLPRRILDEHKIVAASSNSANADIFRILRTKIMQSITRDGLHSIAVTSPKYGDGKSTIAVNLALSIALDVKQTVLLVDLDLRRPNVHNCLGLKPVHGIADYLLGDVPLTECFVRIGERLVVLPGDKEIGPSSEVIGTPKMMSLAKELAARYPDRIVIYDMPPILNQDDALAFIPNVDGVLVVVRDGVTEVSDLNECLYGLRDHNVIGTILNRSSARTERSK